MKNLNFATRITIATASKSDSSNMYANERMKVLAETNSRPVVIDFSVFQKTAEEKEELVLAKAHWKAVNAIK
jgi:hypothetical protein